MTGGRSNRRRRTRRRVLRLAAAVGVTGVAGCSGPVNVTDSGTGANRTATTTNSSTDSQASPTATDSFAIPDELRPHHWPMVRHDARNTAFVEEATGPREQPSEVWRKESQRTPFSAPIVAGDYVFSGGFALDAADGTTRWEIQIGDGGNQTGYIQGFEPPVPALLGGRLFLPNSEVGAGALYALSGTGAVTRWETEIDAVRATSPIVSDGTVFHCGWQITAYDSSDGTGQWTTSTDREVEVPVAVGDGVVVGAAYGGSIYAIERETGEVRWQASVPNQPSGPPVIDDERVYVPSNHVVKAFDLASGDEEWSLHRGFPQLALDESRLIAGRGGGISGIGPSSGVESMRVSLEITEVGPPTIAGDVLYAPTRSPDGLVAFDLASETELWRYETDGIPRPPVPVGDSLYVMLDKHELVCLQ